MSNITNVDRPVDIREMVVPSDPDSIRARSSHFTSQLENSFVHPITSAERDFLVRWSNVLNPEHWIEWEISWLRALSVVETPANFLDAQQFESSEFKLLGRNWPTSYWFGGNNELRRELMGQIKPYEPMNPREHYSFVSDKDCRLCDNVLQAVDSTKVSNGPLSQIMLRLPTGIVMPNRFPGMPLHMLYVPWSHDDYAERVPHSKVEVAPEKFESYIPEQVGKTRGALLELHELVDLFSFCSTMGLAAVRNHPLSGMSVPTHDHWHVFPLECFSSDWMDLYIDFSFEKVPSLFKRATGTPFDVLTVSSQETDAGVGTLAWRARDYLNELERDGQIFAPVFVPSYGEEKRAAVLIAPLRKQEVNDFYKQIGGSVQFHGFSAKDSSAVALFDQMVPKTGEFNWRGLPSLQKSSVMTEKLYSFEELSKLYSPLNHLSTTPWGDGSRVLERARQFLPDYPLLDDLCFAVGDHDTRLHLHHPRFRAFLDADWLWRVSLGVFYSESSGELDLSNPSLIYERVRSAIRPQDLTLPWAYNIARLEGANTMLHMKRIQGWDRLPEEFLRDYSDEIAVVNSA